MQTLNARFVEAFQRATVEPVWLVTLEVGDNPDQIWHWVSGSRMLFGYANSISHVSAVGASLDPLTRATSITLMDVVFQDASIRDVLASGQSLKTKKVTLALGTPDLDEEDFEPRFVGVTDDHEPEETQSNLRVMDPMVFAADTAVTGDWIGQRPVDALSDIVGLALLPPLFGDYGSFEPIAAQAHWRLTRTDYLGVGWQARNGVSSPQRAKDLVDELCFLTRGSVRVGEDGVVSYVPYDQAAPVLRVFTREDISSFRQLETVSNTINRFGISFLKDSERIANIPVTLRSPVMAGIVIGRASMGLAPLDVCTFKADDVDAQAADAYLGEAERIIGPEPYSTDWLNAFGELQDDITEAAGQNVHIRAPTLHGFCGSGVDGTGVIVDPADASHIVYLRIDDEIMSCDASFALNPRVIQTWEIQSHFLGRFPQGVGYATLARGLFGSTPAHHTGIVPPSLVNGFPDGQVGTLVYDYTIAVAAALDVVARFSRGCPIVEILVPLGCLGQQLGDFVSFEDDVFASVGFDGATEAMTWEVIGKEERVSDDSPGLVLTLALVPPLPEPAGSIPKYGVPGPVNAISQGLSAVDSYGDKYVGSGAEVTTSGLTATVSPAVINGHGFQARMPELVFDAPASKDSYLSYHSRLSVWELDTLDTGDPAPDWPAEDMPIAKLAAGVASIVVTDLRNLWPFDGRKLADASVEERKLAFKLPGSAGIQIPISVPGWRGTIPLHVESVQLEAGTYDAYALLGTATTTDTGYLQLIRRTGGAPVTPRLEHTGLMAFAPGVEWEIPATDQYDVYIWASSSTAIVLARDLWIKAV